MRQFEIVDRGTHHEFYTAGGVRLSAATREQAQHIGDTLPAEQWESNRGGYLLVGHGDSVDMVRVPCASGACTPDRNYNCDVCGYWVGYWA
ncbi:hypothetical protein SEA_KUDEFRE_145 [Gordonia phage Kudefre]|uniref:Uncharacterized protein n=1 Tax=Gordonia phage Kudefre TaxID=2885975 RepID=A0AAE8Y7J0_9CAUD|nr:hypothetical protein L3Y24_gp098 [Gordonia phage Kudefre]UDL15358.1 hypothetical protein SEA_KUDEFRE_145 [Gordonia phage Kudefre]